MLKRKPNTLSLKFVLFVLPLICAAVAVTAVVLTVHHFLFYNPSPSQFETLLFHTLFLVLLLTVLLCCAAGVLGWFWITRQLRPLHTLHQYIRYIGEGRFDRKIEIDAPSEIGSLASGLNSMACSLKAHIKNEADTTRKSARREAEAAQGTATRKLMHEIGNFLNNIDLVVYGLKPERLSPRGQKIMKILIEESGRIKAFLRRFLRFARTPQLRMQPCHIKPVLADVVSEFESEARESGIRFEIHSADPSPLVRIDAAQIQVVLQNLVRNSFEAIGRSGAIRIDAGPDGQHFRIAVSDSGPGIDPAAGDRAFEPFFTTKQSGGGAGLGLAICRTIVEAHGGTIECEHSPGCGTTISIRLPLAEQAI